MVLTGSKVSAVRMVGPLNKSTPVDSVKVQVLAPSTLVQTPLTGPVKPVTAVRL